MERDQRHFNGKGGGKSQEEPHLHRGIEFATQQRGQVERITASRYQTLVIIAKRDDTRQHKQTAHGGIQHELDGHVYSSFTTPTSNQEIGGNQHQLPENIEQEEIRGEEHAGNAAFQKQHEGHIVLNLLLDVERRGNTHNCQQRGQRNQQ